MGLGELERRDDDGRRPIVEPGCVSRGHDQLFDVIRGVRPKGGPQLPERLQRRIAPGALVGVDDGRAPTRLDQHRDDFLLELTSVHGLDGEAVGAQRELVGLGPRNPRLRGRVLGVASHMAMAERAPQTVQHDPVLEGLISELDAGSQSPNVVRHVGHRLHASGHDQVGIAGSHGLGREHDGLQARPAHLVDRDGRDGRGHPTRNRGLASRGLALTCGNDVPHDDLVDARRIDAGSL